MTFDECGAGERSSEMARIAIRHKKAWADRHGVIAPALMDPRFETFFADVTRGDSHAQPVRVVAVQCDGNPVGVEISLVCKDHLFGHVISYDPDYEKNGVGSVLAEYAVRNALERGFAVYDLLAPADSFKSEWADGHVGVRDWAAPMSFAGKFYARPWHCWLRPRIKHALDNAPRPLGKAYAALFGKAATTERPGSQGV